MPSQNSPRGHTVGAVLNAVRILRLLGSQSEPQRLVKIARALDINGSTCLNILRTLCDERLVQHDENGKTYSIGLGLSELSRRSLMTEDLMTVVQPLLDEFAARHDCSVVLWRRIGDSQIVAVGECRGSQGMYIRTDLGIRLPMLTGSPGRVVAAWGDIEADTLQARFHEVDWAAPFTWDAFMADVAEARRKGWASDEGTITGGYEGLSAPVPRQGPVQHIVNAVMFANQFPAERKRAIGSELAELGTRLSRVMRG